MACLNIKEELKIVGEYESPLYNGFSVGKAPKYNTPISPKENFFRFLKGDHPMWTPCSADFVTIIPKHLPDNVARAFVFDNAPFDVAKESGGKDMFGVEWEYVPTVGGSMVRPGLAAKVSDICEWEKYITFPNLDDYDWEGAAARLKNTVNDDRVVIAWVMNGLFERLISFAEFENAALALIDEDEQDAVHRLFDKLCDMYDDMFDKYHKYLNVDGIYFHDDWGSQRAPFFSKNVCDEMLVPYMKRVCESAHKRGMFIDFHSCGQVELLVPCMIDAGVDIWSGQPMNNRTRILQNHGDKIKLNLFPDMPNIAPRDPEKYEEYTKSADAAIEKFLETYKPYMRSIVVSAMNAGYPKLYEMVYATTREAFAE